MFLIRLQPIAPLFDAICSLTRIATRADVKFSPTKFCIIVSQISPPFIAALQMSPEFFTSFAVDGNHTSRICLDSLHSILMDGRLYPAMTFHLLENQNRLLLRFENSRNLPRGRRELDLSPSEEEDVGEIDYGNCVSIGSDEFRSIVTKLSAYFNHRICATLTDSQVKFSVANEEIILTKEGGQCLIIAPERGVETKFEFTLHPTSFFYDLADKPGGVWLCKSTDSRNIICIPFGLNIHHLMYFPQV
ncbi:uncharacterized protein LOC111014988 [Momordica charantia]|uniref:Uncharacterized protein LOC111014988 n=1 Tax=Momordica charantia TaxID=3673 RepID=A0A6J1CUU8_MOMCH|nr:uncharacterized protein LOC111014988 [Momordica charantia]